MATVAHARRSALEPYSRSATLRRPSGLSGQLESYIHLLAKPGENEVRDMTTHDVLIRDERSTDVNAIRDVTVLAFKTMEISNHTEQFVIEALRAAEALTVSLVAEIDGRIVGHIAFSPVTMSDGTRDWYGLGPVSVHPDFQRKGIGKALIRAGLSRLRDLEAKGCCLVGHPQYYRQFGFENVEGLSYDGVPRDVFFVLSFDGYIPQGHVVFHEGFEVDGQQGTSADC